MMSIESERQGGSKRYEILNLHDACLWLADQQNIGYPTAAKALVGALPGIPAPEPFTKAPLAFKKDVLLHWAGQHRQKLRPAGNAQRLSDIPFVGVSRA
jgi:hypothetical protein